MLPNIASKQITYLSALACFSRCFWIAQQILINIFQADLLLWSTVLFSGINITEKQRISSELAPWLAHHGYCTLNFSLVDDRLRSFVVLWQVVFFMVFNQVTGHLPLMSSSCHSRWGETHCQGRLIQRTLQPIIHRLVISFCSTKTFIVLLTSNCSSSFGLEPESFAAYNLWKALLDRWWLRAVLMCSENSEKSSAHSRSNSDVSKVWWQLR